MFRELVITMYSAYVTNNYLSIDEATASVSQYMSQPQVLKSFGYQSQQVGTDDFHKMICCYSEATPQEWGKLMFNRLRPEAIPDKKLASGIMYGCTQVQNIPLVIAAIEQDNLKPVMTDCVVDSEYTSPRSEKVGDDSETELIRDAAALLAKHHEKAIRRGCDADEIPEGHGKYGYEVTNPIPVRGIAEAGRYLKKLRWQGQPVIWDRIGSFGADNIEMPVDCYEVFDQKSRMVGTIFISPYHQKTSAKAPEGFTVYQDKGPPI